MNSHVEPSLIFATAADEDKLSDVWDIILIPGYSNTQKISIMMKTGKLESELFVQPFSSNVLIAMAENDIETSGMDGMFEQLCQMEAEIRYRQQTPFDMTVDDFQKIVPQKCLHPQMFIGKC